MFNYLGAAPLIPLSILLVLILLRWKYFKNNKPNLILFVFLFTIIVTLIFYNSNPNAPTKGEMLYYIPDQYKPKTNFFDKIPKLDYPFVLKPSLSSSRGKDVAIIHNKKELDNYLGRVDTSDLIIQQYVDSKHEVGILYERNPLEEKGRIVNIVERDIPENGIIVGGSGRQRDDLITLELSAKIDWISKHISDFYVGRYDIKFDSYDDLKKGRNFYILELNSCFGFDIADAKSIGIPQFLYNQYRWFFIRLYYGSINISEGKYNSLKNLLDKVQKCLK